MCKIIQKYPNMTENVLSYKFKHYTIVSCLLEISAIKMVLMLVYRAQLIAAQLIAHILSRTIDRGYN
jgi:hypothetical protein